MSKKKCDLDPKKSNPDKKYRCKKCENSSNSKDKLCKAEKVKA